MKHGNMKKETRKQKIGRIGEDIACRFLVKHGFDVTDRNYLKRWGEIDIIAKKRGILHFVEVKTVTCETHSRPEENVHQWKIERLKRVIQTYLWEKFKQDVENPEWQFDVIAVFLDVKHRRAHCRFSENIIL